MTALRTHLREAAFGNNLGYQDAMTPRRLGNHHMIRGFPWDFYGGYHTFLDKKWGFLGFVCGICRICLAIIGVLAGRKLGVTSNKQQPGILWGCNGEFSWGAPHPQILDRDQQDVWFIAFCHMIGTQPRRQGCNCITRT